MKNQHYVVDRQGKGVIDIRKLRIGIVVYHPETGMYGHLTGFAYNPANELIICVKWPDDENPTSIHPANCEIYVD